MSFYNKDFETEIQTKWWDLMSSALKDKLLCVSLEKHINSENLIVLLVTIYPINKEPKTIYYKFDLESSMSLYYDAEKFIKEYNLEK